jgi:predicted O-linked N-acetylglucosamine transferase (SPINDLY family)
LGNLYLQQGQAGKALECYRQAVAAGDDRIAFDCLIFSSLYDPDSTGEDILRECARWRTIHGDKLRQTMRPHSNDRNPDRPLRIGYVSPDLCRHPISRFLLPILSNHDRANYEIYCYSDVLKPDAITEVIQTKVDGWRPIAGVSDEMVAEMIRADQIDILVDLAMRTAKNRMFVFGRKPAPVQTCYLAYIGTTGLEAMDYRISDVYLDPPGDTSKSYTEKTVRLPHCVWCYAELEAGQIPLVPPPAKKNGYVTFGSLNTFSKMNPRVLDTWAEIMRRVPDSRLIMHCLPGSHREAVWSAIDGHGIARERVRMLERQLINRYLSSYNEIDIALDPFPYPGGTTTCDALWMGLPVVTLAGERGMSRAGASLLSNVGLPELIGNGTEQYIQIATSLAGDLHKLTDLRESMRKRMRSSPLMDSKLLAKDLEAAYRQMWKEWVAG